MYDLVTETTITIIPGLQPRLRETLTRWSATAGASLKDAADAYRKAWTDGLDLDLIDDPAAQDKVSDRHADWTDALARVSGMHDLLSPLGDLGTPIGAPLHLPVSLATAVLDLVESAELDVRGDIEMGYNNDADELATLAWELQHLVRLAKALKTRGQADVRSAAADERSTTGGITNNELPMVEVPDELLPFLRAVAIYRIDRVIEIFEDGPLRGIAHGIFDPKAWGAASEEDKRAAVDARNQMDEAFAVLDLVGDPSTDAPAPGPLPASLVAELAQEALEQMRFMVREAAENVTITAGDVDTVTKRAQLMGQMIILREQARALVGPPPAGAEQRAAEPEAVNA